MADLSKSTATAKSAAQPQEGGNLVATLAPIACIVAGYVIWRFVLGNASNFTTPDPSGGFWPAHKGPKGTFTKMYEGGIVVPILIGSLLIVLTFVIERLMTIKKAAGKGNLDNFVKDVLSQIKTGDVQGAINACDAQEGSVANVIKAGLLKSEQVKKDGLDVDTASENITKEVEQATALEMPMLEKHLTIISTLVSIGTLLGLLGTVSGMIKAFAGLAEGTPDQAELANGISEALINTATGISTSTIAVIAYNYFTSKIDTLTYFIDEAGFAISQAYKRAKGSN